MADLILVLRSQLLKASVARERSRSPRAPPQRMMATEDDCLKELLGPAFQPLQSLRRPPSINGWFTPILETGCKHPGWSVCVCCHEQRKGGEGGVDKTTSESSVDFGPPELERHLSKDESLWFVEVYRPALEQHYMKFKNQTLPKEWNAWADYQDSFLDEWAETTSLKWQRELLRKVTVIVQWNPDEELFTQTEEKSVSNSVCQTMI